MVEAWILTIFCLAFSIPIAILERKKKRISQRKKYDTVVRHIIALYTQGDEVPAFMNKKAFYIAHRTAVQICQEGKLNKCYEMIMRGAL